jgi:hypothetical protein
MRGTVTQAVVLSAALIGLGTAYSVYYMTWLDTSNPHVTNAPHPLQDTHYFASKQNPLNILFIKRLWFWTTASFTALFQASPERAQTWGRAYRFTTATALWFLFTAWFFGPAVLERVISLTGGACSVTLPTGYVVDLPLEFCQPGGPRAVSPATHPGLFAASLAIPELPTWSARPRMRRGHDISGHIFLLTMSTLFLVDQIAEFRRATGLGPRNAIQKAALAGATAVVGLEFFSMYITGLYFHTATEKFSGFREWKDVLRTARWANHAFIVLGLAGYIITQAPFLQSSASVHDEPVSSIPVQTTSGAGPPLKMTDVAPGQEGMTDEEVQTVAP